MSTLPGRQRKSVLETVQRIAEFHIIILPKWHTDKLNDAESASLYIKKCRAHLLLYSDVRKRRHGPKNVYALRMHQMVVHRHIPRDVSDDLANELSEIFPSRLKVETDDQLIGMEIASNWMGEAAKYFIAVASMISGDLDLAENMFLSLKNSRFLAGIRGQKGVGRLRSRAIDRLGDVYNIQCVHVYNSWRKSHQAELMEQLNEKLDKLEKIT